MSNQKELKGQIHRLNEQLRQVRQQKEAQQHQNKKALFEASTKLDFQTRRADEYEEKYKSTLQYKNQEESVMELDEKLRDKENQIIQLMRLDHDKSQEIQAFMDETQQLKKDNFKLQNDLNQIKEAALNAIVDKDTTISELTERLQQYQNSESINNLKGMMVELQQKYTELEDKLEANRIQYIGIIDGKDEDIIEYQQKLHALKDKHDERVTRLEMEITNYEKHIEEITAERDHEQNFQEKYYHAEERLRKAERKMSDLQQKAIDERSDLMLTLQKAEEQLKEGKSKISHYESVTASIKHEWDEAKEKFQKILNQNTRKISHLEGEKKIISDNLMGKLRELERLRAELDEKSRLLQPSLNKERSATSVGSPTKSTSDDNSGLIQKLKKQNKDLQEANQSLKRKLQEQTKELQQSRQKLLQARGSDSKGELNKLMIQIQDLTSYLKKVQCDMLMKKITHAQDENYWSIKEKKFKEDIESLNKKYKKENSQLLERIDRMKKLVPKDKKNDYYQSGFK